MGTEQPNDSDRRTGSRGWVAEHGGTVLVIPGGLVLVVGHVVERDLLVLAGLLTLGVGVVIEGFIRRRGGVYKAVAALVAVALLMNGLDLLFPSQPLWVAVIDAVFLVGLFVAGFAALLYVFRRDLDEELERLLFYRAGTYAFFVTICASFAYWGLRNAHETERARELAHGARTGIPLPEPSLIWVVLFGVGVWLVSMGVLWWRSH